MKKLSLFLVVVFGSSPAFAAKAISKKCAVVSKVKPKKTAGLHPKLLTKLQKMGIPKEIIDKIGASSLGKLLEDEHSFTKVSIVQLNRSNLSTDEAEELEAILKSRNIRLRPIQFKGEDFVRGVKGQNPSEILFFDELELPAVVKNMIKTVTPSLTQHPTDLITRFLGGMFRPDNFPSANPAVALSAHYVIVRAMYENGFIDVRPGKRPFWSKENDPQAGK